MSEITIRKCLVRVVRRGGWSWGADPKSLADRVVRAIPALIAEQLSRFGRMGEDVEITAPLSIRVVLTHTELMEAIESPVSGTPLADSALEARFAQALEMALIPHLPARSSRNLIIDPPPAQRKIAVEFHPEPDKAGSVASVLLGWHAQGQLGLHLRWFSLQALNDWHLYLRSSSGSTRTRVSSPHERGDVNQPLPIEDIQKRNAELGPIGPSRSDQLRRRLVLAIPLIEECKCSPNDSALWDAIDRCVPLIENPEVAKVQESGDVRRPLSSASDAPHSLSDQSKLRAGSAELQFTVNPTDQSRADRLRSTDLPQDRAMLPNDRPTLPAVTPRGRQGATVAHGEVYVKYALPFLMLGPLAQIGFLDTLGATFEASDLTDRLPAYATALAYKVLPPPELGWLRSGEARAAAAAFAGRFEPIDDADPHRLERQAETLCSPLDAVIVQALLEGHCAGEPLLIWRDIKGGGWLLVEVAGGFTIAWSSTFEGLCDGLTQVESEWFLIPGCAADPAVLHKANERGLRFVTDVPPARGEVLRAVRHGSQSWWTNDRGSPQGVVVRQALKLDEAEASAASSWANLATVRQALPLAKDRTWERSLALAAGLGLAQISWTLWQDRELSGPLLALERFTTLDARVRFGEESIHVTLPLGARSMDLGRNGFLDDVRNVPWLGGRTVTFSKG